MGRGECEVSLIRDERGAVLLMGVFMCSALVGMLWYVAGIGDAIIYRERLQEAADAAAFSTAVLNARAMNVVVMINLIMACVLGVRVILKALQLVLSIAAVLCAVIPGLQGFVSLCISGVTLMQRAIESTRPIINNTLQALSSTQDGIAVVAPSAADAGGLLVARRYEPVAAPLFPTNVPGRRLPLVEDEIGTLCAEAGESIVGLLSLAMPPGLRDGRLVELVGNLVGEVVSQGGAYFCEFGSGSAAPPNLDAQLDRAARDKCSADEGSARSDRDASNRTYRDTCRALGASCDGNPGSGKPLSAEDERKLSMLKSDRDNRERAVAGFDSKKCQDSERNRAKNAGGARPARLASGDGMTPKKVDPAWQNGAAQAQQRSVVKGEPAFLERAFSGVQVGASKPVREAAPSGRTPPHLGFAQAEFFFDCKGKWSSRECNGPEQHELAMWSFRWRARLRRCDRSFSTILSAFGFGEVLESVEHQTLAPGFAAIAVPAAILELKSGALH
jgi:hypothetical protein